MARTKQNWLKRGLSLLLAAMLMLSMSAVSAFAEGTDIASTPGTYVVPVKSLVSAAPLPPVQQAFANAFGENAEVTVDQNGDMTAKVNLQHMVINLMGEYHANVLTIEGATYLSYKTEKSSTKFGDVSAVEEIQVPDEVQFPLTNASDDGSYVLEITVDFMNAFLGGGKPYPTDVTLTLDFENAKADASELEDLVNSYRQLSEENYTPETWAAFEGVLAEAEAMIENGASMDEINAMIDRLTEARDALEYAGADYSAVEAALDKIPEDGSLYTEASWDALQEAKEAVKYGLTKEDQATVDGWAEDIESKIAELEYKDADYTNVDKAIASVPADLSQYTDESVAALNSALDAVVRDLKANDQVKVDKMASDIEAAVKALTLKDSSTGSDDDTSDKPLDKDNLEDGIYEVSIQLWHATNDQASMAAASIETTARIVVKDGAMTMYIYTKPMTFGTITASLQEMKVADADGNYSEAKVEKKDASGNPTCFSFVVPHTQEYIKVKVNPHVAMMGNQDLDARVKVDYSSLKKISTDSSDPSVDVVTPADPVENPNTDGDSNVLPFMMVALISAGMMLALSIRGKRKASQGE